MDVTIKFLNNYWVVFCVDHGFATVTLQNYKDAFFFKKYAADIDYQFIDDYRHNS